MGTIRKDPKGICGANAIGEGQLFMRHAQNTDGEEIVLDESHSQTLLRDDDMYREDS